MNQKTTSIKEKVETYLKNLPEVKISEEEASKNRKKLCGILEQADSLIHEKWAEMHDDECWSLAAEVVEMLIFSLDDDEE